MIVGGQTEARSQLSSTIIDYHEPFDQGLIITQNPLVNHGAAWVIATFCDLPWLEHSFCFHISQLVSYKLFNNNKGQAITK